LFCEGATQKTGGFFCCGETRTERKGCVVNLDHNATEDPAEMAIWTQDSLEYAHDHGQRKLIWLLESVRVEVKLEDELLALQLGEHLGSRQNVSSGREKVHA
jgi:hypothetical protein